MKRKVRIAPKGGIPLPPQPQPQTDLQILRPTDIVNISFDSNAIATQINNNIIKPSNTVSSQQVVTILLVCFSIVISRLSSLAI